MKFGAVATNLCTGRKPWFTHHDLYQTSRASGCMSDELSPVARNDARRLYGPILNPAPTLLTHRLWQDVMITLNSQHNAHLMQPNIPLQPFCQPISTLNAHRMSEITAQAARRMIVNGYVTSAGSCS